MVRVAQYSRYDFYEFLYVDVLAGKLFFSFQFWREYAWVVVRAVASSLFPPKLAVGLHVVVHEVRLDGKSC